MLPAAQAAAGAFSLCTTQWVHGPAGDPTGLRYDGCMAVLLAAARERGEPEASADRLLMQVQHVERAVLQVHAERAARKG